MSRQRVRLPQLAIIGPCCIVLLNMGFLFVQDDLLYLIPLASCVIYRRQLSWHRRIPVQATPEVLLIVISDGHVATDVVTLTNTLLPNIFITQAHCWAILCLTTCPTMGNIFIIIGQKGWCNEHHSVNTERRI